MMYGRENYKEVKEHDYNFRDKKINNQDLGNKVTSPVKK